MQSVPAQHTTQVPVGLVPPLGTLAALAVQSLQLRPVPAPVSEPKMRVRSGRHYLGRRAGTDALPDIAVTLALCHLSPSKRLLQPLQRTAQQTAWATKWVHTATQHPPFPLRFAAGGADGSVQRLKILLVRLNQLVQREVGLVLGCEGSLTGAVLLQYSALQYSTVQWGARGAAQAAPPCSAAWEWQAQHGCCSLARCLQNETWQGRAPLAVRTETLQGKQGNQSCAPCPVLRFNATTQAAVLDPRMAVGPTSVLLMGAAGSGWRSACSSIHDSSACSEPRLLLVRRATRAPPPAAAPARPPLLLLPPPAVGAPPTLGGEVARPLGTPLAGSEHALSCRAWAAATGCCCGGGCDGGCCCCCCECGRGRCAAGGCLSPSLSSSVQS